MLQRFPVTFGLCLLVATTFVLQQVMGGTMDPETLLRLGALRSDRLVAYGEFYRLFTSMFLHVGPVHILLNGLALFQLGLLTESLYGSVRTLAFYLVSGLVGALGSAAMMSPYLPGSVGASGAIMGLAGVIFGLQAYGEPWVRERLNELIGYRLAAGIGLTFALGIGLQLFFLPFVDNWCHLAGFLTGMGLAFAYPDPNDETQRVDQYAAALLAMAVVVSGGAAAVDGGRATETFDLDTAHSLELRLQDQPDGWIAGTLAMQMVEHYREAESPTTGQEALQKAVDQMSERATVTALAGAIYDNHWDVENGIVTRRWLELAPDDPVALNAMAWHMVMREDESLRDPVGALPLSVRSIELLAADPALELAGGGQYLDTQAEILLQLGRLEEAHALQLEAVARERAREVPLYEKVYRGLGLIPEAPLAELERRLVTIEERLES